MIMPSSLEPIQLAAWTGVTERGDTSRGIPIAFDMGTFPARMAPRSFRSCNKRRPPARRGLPPRKNVRDPSTATCTCESRNGGGQFYGSRHSDVWHWQVLPDGLIYRSYQAGVREPRLVDRRVPRARRAQSLWDGTLGGRVGLLRYGTCDELYPQGWQLDVEAAAIVRLTLDEIRDFETADYRVGVPLTYGVDNWQFKFAVYHLSSHLGDEFAIANPGSLDERINYVRDALVVGASYYPHPVMRLYSEAAYAVNVDGGAEPWEFQFGTEVSRPGPTGPHGTPFLAVNAPPARRAQFRRRHHGPSRLAVARPVEGQVMRVGLHYYNGKSSQYQTFDDSEQQIGFGLWYDF